MLLFLLHLVYLAFWSPDPFLKKWIDGSFTFFLALVLCNIIRTRLTATVGQDKTTEETAQPQRETDRED